MGAKEQNATGQDRWFRGEDRSFTYEITVGRTTTSRDMSGWSGITWELKPALDTATASAAISKTLGSGIAVGTGDATGSKITVTVDAADSVGLTPGSYIHTVRRTDSGSVGVLAEGTITLHDHGLS